MTNIQPLVTNLIECVIVVLNAAIVTVLLPAFFDWIKVKIHNQKLNDALDEIENAAKVAVDYVEQTIVTQLKKDGKWNSETQKEAFQTALKTVLNNLTNQTSDYLKNNKISIADTVTKYIESAILHSKEQ